MMEFRLAYLATCILNLLHFLVYIPSFHKAMLIDNEMYRLFFAVGYIYHAFNDTSVPNIINVAMMLTFYYFISRKPKSA
jgi:hypothetical protein